MTSVVSTDFCHFVKPNNKYIGIGLYRKYTQTGDKYFVFTLKSTEMWELSFETVTDSDIEVNIGEKSHEVNDLGVTHRFSLVKNRLLWMC